MDGATLHDRYPEIGTQKVFAVAFEWPGWCRFERDEEIPIEDAEINR